MQNILRIISTTAFLLIVSTSLKASSVTFDLSYSGTPFGNTAIGTGFVTFDDNNLPNPGHGDTYDGTLTVLDFGLTITDASSGNGSFNLADFGSFLWQVGNNEFDASLNLTVPGPGEELGPEPSIDLTPEPSIDLTTELVGQTGFIDFNFFGPESFPQGPSLQEELAPEGSSAPTGTLYFEITTNNAAGDRLLLQSMTPSAVPVPAAIWLFASGMIGLIGLGKRKQA